MPRLPRPALAAALLAASLLGSSHGAAVSAAQKAEKAGHFIKNLRSTQELRICNAYPFGSALNIRVNKVPLSETPMGYKTCNSFKPKLKVGDRVVFSIEDTDAGTFTISELPAGDATLLMVIYRRDGRSTAAAFESHVFSGQALAQIAVLDTYKGKAKAEMRIGMPPHQVVRSPRKAAKGGAADAALLQENSSQPELEVESSELLRYDNVVAVDPGEYELSLKDEKTGDVTEKADLVALQRESYVVVRCGVESEMGDSYPQELMVYPHSNKADLPTPPPPPTRSGSAPTVVSGWLSCLFAAIAAAAPLGA